MTKDAASVFFSYSRDDSDFVLKLAKDLKEAGAGVWLDQLDISPGQHWDTAVEEALASCPNMLLVLSPSSVGSAIVMDEVAFALDEKKIVIPVLHRDCKIPLRLRRLQYIDARAEYKQALAELIRMLAGREQGVNATPEPARDEDQSGYNSNLAAIATGLKKITGSGFLIVSHDEIYVQFTSSGGSSGIYCEAVGEKYSKKKFTAEQVKELRTLGFEFDEKGHGNWSLTASVANSDEIEGLAKWTLTVFESVYGVAANQPLKVEVTLE